MFVCDFDGNAYTIPRQNDIKIEWINRTYFVITDPRGIKYTFGRTSASRETIKYRVGEYVPSTENSKTLLLPHVILVRYLCFVLTI